MNPFHDPNLEMTVKRWKDAEGIVHAAWVYRWPGEAGDPTIVLACIADMTKRGVRPSKPGELTTEPVTCLVCLAEDVEE